MKQELSIAEMATVGTIGMAQKEGDAVPLWAEKS